MQTAPVLTPDLLADPVTLTAALVDIESVSGNEARIADEVQAALSGATHLEVARAGNVVCARTHLGRPSRVVLAGHLDTVPVADNLPSRTDHEAIHGCGTSDMKSGDAVALHLAVSVADPGYDVTYLFYDCEEIGSDRNGLELAGRSHPAWFAADLAILLEPTSGLVEAGCQGTMRAMVTTTGRRAHSARSWLGVNAVHAAGELLRRLDGYAARRVDIDGCEYREGLNAVGITGGVAGNVIPDECTVEVNYRFAPDRSAEQAAEHVRAVFDGYPVEILDVTAGAPPELTAAPARHFLECVGTPPLGKLGWTDVARFARLGVPALNFGPGNPNLAHARDERVEIAKIRQTAQVLEHWLRSGA
jgi:succinyl-diaminopimelate desuccinylase